MVPIDINYMNYLFYLDNGVLGDDSVDKALLGGHQASVEGSLHLVLQAEQQATIGGRSAHVHITPG